MNTGVTQIMWGHIFFTIFFLYVLRTCVDWYIVKRFEEIHKSFYSNEWSGLKEKIEKHQNISIIFSEGPWNKTIRGIYNTLCAFRASIALVEEDEEQFLKQMNYVKKDNEFEWKFFVMSLYYRSKDNSEKAMYYYQRFSECEVKSRSVEIIMDIMFSAEESGYSDMDLKEAVEYFRNPAIIKLLHVNGMK